MINIDLRNKVKELYKDKNINPRTILLILNKNIEIKKLVEKEFNKKPNLYLTIGKLICLILKDLDLSTCFVCGKELNYNLTTNGRDKKFCSNKCKLSKEGNPFSRKDIREKIKENNIKKYGVDNPAKTLEIQNKIKQTNLEKYGVENVFQSNIIKEKSKNSLKERYNVDNIYDNIELRKKAIDNKRKNTYNKIIKKYKDLYIPMFTANEYIGSNIEYNWKCLKCGSIFKARYDDGIINSRCFKCYPRQYIKSSSYEKEICDFISTLNLKTELSNRTIIKPKELDIVILEKQVAIEFNGSYWHSTEIHKDTTYHLSKTEDCEKAGYKLIHIYEYQWQNKSNILKEKIKAILDIDQKRIYARKCIIKDISSKEKNDFLNNYHIQGEDKSNIKLGLFYDNELVAVMTFGKPRFNTKYEYELIRYATKAGYKVLGGAGKLLKFFERTYNPKSLITYADRSYSQGNMYKQIGFKELLPSGPNYVYVKDNIVLSRYQCKKHKLKTLLSNFNEELSETENILNNDYYKIYDSGNLVFVKIY